MIALLAAMFCHVCPTPKTGDDTFAMSHPSAAPLVAFGHAINTSPAVVVMLVDPGQISVVELCVIVRAAATLIWIGPRKFVPKLVIVVAPVIRNLVDSCPPMSHVVPEAISSSGFSNVSLIASHNCANPARAVALLGFGYVSDMLVFNGSAVI